MGGFGRTKEGFKSFSNLSRELSAQRSPGMRGVSIGGNVIEGDLLRGMINHKSLFSSVRMDQCQMEGVSEGEEVSSACHPAASLAANSPTPAPLSLHLISSPQFLEGFFFFFLEEQVAQQKRLRGADFLASFSWVVVLNRPRQIRGTASFFFVCPHK